MKGIFLNSSNKLRDIWWIAVFFIVLLGLLLPTILIAQANSLEVSIPVQGLIIILTTWLSQLLRKVSFTEVTGEFNSKRIKEFGIGIGIGTLLMLIPVVILYGFNIVDYSVGVISFDVLLNGFIICISVAITEEALFRVYFSEVDFFLWSMIRANSDSSFISLNPFWRIEYRCRCEDIGISKYIYRINNVWLSVY